MSWRGRIGLEHKIRDLCRTETALTANADCSGAEFGPNGPGAEDNMFYIAQGTAYSQRNGRHVALSSLYIQGQIRWPLQAAQAASDEQTLITLWLILDSQTNGAAMNSEDMLNNPTAEVTAAPCALQNPYYTHRFRLLKKIMIRRPPVSSFNDAAGTGAVNAQVVPFKMYVPLKGMRVSYTGTTGALSEIEDNCVHLLAVASSTDGSPVISYNARVRFYG